MNHKVHNQIVNFIWGIADDVLRDVFVRGKYRDIILPFTVLRRLDALLESSKEKILEAERFLTDNGIDDKSGLSKISGYPFYNSSPFTMGLNGPKNADFPFVSLLSDPDNIDSNLESYLDGFSPKVQEIISKFKIRNQLESLQEAGLTYDLIEKFTSSAINLSPKEVINAKGDILPPLTNLGMGYVFEELIRRFNEENNEEAGEHFTPREIIRLMTHILFEPIAEELRRREHARFTIYDPACGSGGMLTEAEDFAREISGEKCDFSLFGQEVNPETWAICTGDMLIKGESPENIAFGSTLSREGFPNTRFDFMLSNPPYGKSWKIDMGSIINDKKKILDPRFTQGVPRSSDGQLLFLMDMASRMKSESDLGSRVASVHNGSALFTGDAGSGESEIRRCLIENDWLDCIIGLPKNMFYNTGIATYIFILSNNKAPHRRGKIQLIDASEMYRKMRKSLGNKSNEFSKEQIRRITQLYLDFQETPESKIFDNADFGYRKITIERPLRLSARFTPEAVESLRFFEALREPMAWIYGRFGDAVYQDLSSQKERILKHFEAQAIKLSPANKKKVLDAAFWRKQRDVLETARRLAEQIGDTEYDDFTRFSADVEKALKTLGLKPGAAEKKQILNAVTWKDEGAQPVIKKRDKDGAILYEADSELRDTENVPLRENIHDYVAREVLPHVPDAWFDESKTVAGYEISFTKYFYSYEPLRSLGEITQDLLDVDRESEGLLRAILDAESFAN